MGEIHSWGHREDDVGHALANEEEVECCEWHIDFLHGKQMEDSLDEIWEAQLANSLEAGQRCLDSIEETKWSLEWWYTHVIPALGGLRGWGGRIVTSSPGWVT